jgi:hypothetical protein
VTGDNFVNFLDVIAVLNKIRNPALPEPEGEPMGEGEPAAEGEPLAATTSSTTTESFATAASTPSAPVVSQYAVSQYAVAPVLYTGATQPLVTPTFNLAATSNLAKSSSTSSSHATAIDLRTVFTGAELQVSAGFTSNFDDVSNEEPLLVQQPVAELSGDSPFDDDPWSDELESALDDIADDVSESWLSEESADDVFGELAEVPVGPLDEEEL